MAFIEDTCVDPEQLGRYIAGLDRIGRRQGVTLCYYGHAGDGELHVRPYLDLSRTEDVQRMKALAEEVFSLVWSLGGSISGEHAYGLVRAGFVRRQFGDAYVEVLRQIKQTFDPKGLLNPGKVVNDDPDVMTRHLRRSSVFIPERTDSELLFEPEEVALEIIQCNGCGLCVPAAATSGCVRCSRPSARSWPVPGPRPTSWSCGPRARSMSVNSSRRSSDRSWICVSTARPAATSVLPGSTSPSS